MKKGRLLVSVFFTWLVFVVSLALWWMIFSLNLIQKFHEQNPLSHMETQRTMLITEGSVLILFLFFGGAALIYYARREQKRLSEVQLFFSAFSHDLKTSIARLVLQGEQLSQKFPQTVDFQKNLLLLEMQLENSLHLAQIDQFRLLPESIDLRKIIVRLHTQWPSLQIHLQGKEAFLADKTALESVLKNLINNSLLHGEADEIFLKSYAENSWVWLEYTDNAKKKILLDPSELGLNLQPSKNGSGLGLHIVRRWMKAQKASIEFSRSEQQTLVVKMRFLKFEGAS